MMKQKTKLVLNGDMVVVGTTTENNYIIYIKKTNDTKVVQSEILKGLGERNRIVNQHEDLDLLSTYNTSGTEIVVDRGIYIIGKNLKCNTHIGYKIFGKSAKPLDISSEHLKTTNRTIINPDSL